MLPLFITLLAFLLRLFWISDMEFKVDEASTLHFIEQIEKIPYTPLSPIAEHSGIPHSSGFFYFLKLISLGTTDPIYVCASIAVANSIGISLGAWLCRKSEKALLTFAMCATSINLVLGSRKIWAPDLVAFWIYLFMGLFLYSHMDSRSPKKIALGLAAFCITMAGHMYLPGLCYALITTLWISLWLGLKRQKSSFISWSLGSLLGWVTWIPYASSMWEKASILFTHQNTLVDSIKKSAKMNEFWDQLGFTLTLPSPFGSENLYLLKHLSSIREKSPTILLNMVVITMTFLCLFWILTFLVSIFQTIRRRKTAILDPMLCLSFAILIGTFSALQIVKLGVFLHYWLGAIPFTYYIIAWAYDSVPIDTKNRSRFKQWIWFGMSGSVIALFFFFLLVRQSGGLEGEYKMTYQSQIHRNGP